MKEIMSTAKELAWKAYVDGILDDMMIKFERLSSDDQVRIRTKFENWWSDNYGNRDTTKFNPEVNIYIENRRYIQAE